MNTGVVSKRFAKALLDFATERGKEEVVYREAKALASQYFLVPDLDRTISNPMLEKDKKLALLKVAAGGDKISAELVRFFELVLDSKREAFLQFMMWTYISLYREAKNIVTGKLITAVPSERLVKHLESLIGDRNNKTVELESMIDPSIIGGFIIEAQGYRMDASVSNQLERVKRQFINKNRRIV